MNTLMIFKSKDVSAYKHAFLIASMLCEVMIFWFSCTILCTNLD